MTTGRFNLLPLPVAAPGKCICCSSGTKPVVDFGVSLDWDGAVYFCVDCLKEAAGLIGYVAPEKYEDALKDSARINGALQECQEQIRNYNEQQLALAERLGDSLDSVLGAPVCGTQERIEFTKDPEPDDSGTDGTPEQKSKPNRKQRSVSVSSDRSDAVSLDLDF